MIGVCTLRLYAPIHYRYAHRTFQHVCVCPPAPVDNRPVGGNVFRHYILPKGDACRNRYRAVYSRSDNNCCSVLLSIYVVCGSYVNSLSDVVVSRPADGGSISADSNPCSASNSSARSDTDGATNTPRASASKCVMYR